MAVNQSRGLLRIATDVAPARVDPGAIASNLPSTGIERTMGQIGAEFAQIGDRIGKMADHAAQVEGQQAGKIAGLDPEFRPTNAMTIRGEAYDKAGLDIWASNAQIAISGELGKAWDSHQDNPARLNQAIGEIRGQWLDKVPQQVRPEFELMFRKQQLTYQRQAARQQAARVAAEHKAATEGELVDRLKSLQQRAGGLGLDPEADAILADDLRGLSGTLKRRGPDGKPLYTPTEQARLLRGAEEDVTTSRLLGAFGRLPSTEAKQKFIADLEGDWKKSEGLARVYDLNGIRKVTGQLEGELRQARVQDDAVRRAVTKEVTSFDDAIKRGIPIAPERHAAIEARVAGIGDPELAAQWEDSKALIAWQATARRMTPGQLDQVVRAGRDELSGGIANPRQLRHLTVAESLLTEMRGELKRDPLGWAERVGLVGQVTPLETAPDKAVASFSARASQAEAVAAHYGQAPVYLRPDEKALIATQIAQGGGESLQTIGLIAGASQDRALAIMNEISDHAPAVAMLGGLVAKAGPVEAARDAADGFAIRRQPDYKSIVPQGPKVRAATHEAIGGALTGMPEAESAAVTLANSIYEVRARRQGLTEFEPSVWKKGLREALGERTIAGETYGGIGYPSSGVFRSGHPVIVPPDVKTSAIGTLKDAIRMEDLISEHGDRPKDERGRDVSIATVRGSTLVTDGDGKYRLATGDPTSDEPRWIYDSSGRPYVLDLNRLGPRLRQRVPDAFLGGAR